MYSSSALNSLPMKSKCCSTPYVNKQQLIKDVYKCAQNGELTRLLLLLRQVSPDMAKEAIHARIRGATPLIIACKNGHMNVIRCLVKDYNIDIEETGSIQFDGETIEEAPPLWCAAAAGHLPIVKFLIQSGAKVNSTTKTNSTPLRAACFDGHLDIVKYLVAHEGDIEIPNRHGHTCLMIACYRGHEEIVQYLLKINARVNKRSARGNTALHDSAEAGHLEIMKLLLGAHANMTRDDFNVTPLLAAAASAHGDVVDWLVDRKGIDRQEKIDALELLGATYIDKKRDMPAAISYWKLALELRNWAPKVPKPEGKNSFFEGIDEPNTAEELDELFIEPDTLRMLALMTRERILGPTHPDTSYFIRYRGAVYADMGRFDRCIALWMYALDMQRSICPPLNSVTLSNLLSFAELFVYLMHPTNNFDRELQFSDLFSVLQKSVNELERGHRMRLKVGQEHDDTDPVDRALRIIVHLLCIAAGLFRTLKDDQQFMVQELCYHAVSLGITQTDGATMLHMACNSNTTTIGKYPVCTFPSIDLVRLLVDVGANTNAVMNLNQTPLHIAASNSVSCPDLMMLLLKSGVHFDRLQADGRTAMQIYDSKSAGSSHISTFEFDSLQCMCARTIVEQSVNYKGNLTKRLEDFVGLHDPAVACAAIANIL